MANTHASKCLLATKCSLANSDKCNNFCASYVSMHGMNGRSGRVGLANVPADYRLVTVNNSPAREAQAQVYKNVNAYVSTFERQFDGEQRIKSLYLFSESPGTGKTTTACAILNEYLTTHYIGSLKRNRQALQQPALFFDVNEFQTRYNLATMTNNEAEMESIRSTILRVQAVPFAVLDDIGVRSATEAFRAYLHAIINHRVTNGLPTVYTSNLPSEEMAVVFDARMYDRMRDQCGVLTFSGASKRGMRR